MKKVHEHKITENMRSGSQSMVPVSHRIWVAHTSAMHCGIRLPPQVVEA